MSFLKTKESGEAQVDFDRLPRHVAIIMDGNGRWAKRRGLPRTAGHAAGAETFRSIATYCQKIGLELTNTNVRYLLTIYHLSQARLEVSSKDIAQTLDVSRASVTSMMSILTDKRLVTKERYGKVHLTDDGCRWARVLASQTDKLAETLQNRMELSYEEAWKAACAAVSELPRHCFEPIHVPDRQRKEVFQS